MPINLVKIGTSAAIGVVDIVAEEADKRFGYTEPFRNIHDILRAAEFGFGLVHEGLGLGIIPSDVAESMMDASLPLLEKSIYEAVKKMAGAGAGYKKVIVRKVGETRTTTAPATPAATVVSV